MTEEIRYIANLQRQEEFDNEVTELKDKLKRLEQENKDFEILVKSLYKRIEELEKENEALAFRERLYKADYEASEQENKMIINEYNKLQAEIIGDMEFKEIMLTGITPVKVLQNLKERNRELQAFYDVHESFKTDFDANRKLLDSYRSALDTIQRMVLSAWEQGKYLDDGLYNDLTNEFAKINEVLK